MITHHDDYIHYIQLFYEEKIFNICLYIFQFCEK